MKLFVLGIAALASFGCGAIENDKILHAGVSTAIGAASYAYTEDYTTSMISCVAVGLAKEVYDEVDYGGFDEKDLMYDALGCATGIILMDYGLSIKYDTSDVFLVYNMNF